MFFLSLAISPEERESIVKIWRYGGHILGVPEAILFTSEAEARRIYKIGHLCEPPPDDDAIGVANAVFKAIPAMAGVKTEAERKSLQMYAYRLSRVLIGNELADRYGYPNTIRIRYLVLLYLRAKTRLINLLTKNRLLQEQSFTKIFEATQYDKEGISYRMPDHVRATQQSPWSESQQNLTAASRFDFAVPESGTRCVRMVGKHKVVVIGAGTAGLAAAYTLLKQKAELDVTVLEAADKTGGRMGGDEVDRFYIDRTASLFLQSYATARSLAEDLGVPLKQSPHTKGGYVYSNGGFREVFASGTLKQRLQTARTLLSFRLLSFKGMLQFARFFKLSKAQSETLDIDDMEKLLPLDKPESFQDYMEANAMGDYLHQWVANDIRAYTGGGPEQSGVASSMALLWNFSLNPAERVRGAGRQGHVSLPGDGGRCTGPVPLERFRDCGPGDRRNPQVLSQNAAGTPVFPRLSLV